ncbi:hypothetical protein E4H12_05115 [Candidatus Thorarchaeota archaeon]|nr:MAG: hypothetical protein E4H12_05115 [Candidatus Thorarchaeota archaeon]
MLGKGITKLIGFAIAGAIALVAGAELLTSVVSVVLSFRQGDISPLAAVVIITVGLLLIVNRVSEESPMRLILNILAYAVSGYLAVVSFVIVLPYGLIFSGIAAGVTAGICSLIRDPEVITSRLQEFKSQIQSVGSLKGVSKRIIPVGDGDSFALNTFHNILILKEGSRERVIQLMRNRPLLPISLTHFEDCDVLFVDEGSNPAKLEQIIQLLKDLSIQTKGHTSQLLAEAIQMIPIIDSQNGLGMDNYRLARDEKSITELLSAAPVRMTVFPTIHGLRILVPDMAAPGLIVESLEEGKEIDVLLHRDYSLLREVEKPVETTA